MCHLRKFLISTFFYVGCRVWTLVIGRVEVNPCWKKPLREAKSGMQNGRFIMGCRPQAKKMRVALKPWSPPLEWMMFEFVQRLNEAKCTGKMVVIKAWDQFCYLILLGCCNSWLLTFLLQSNILYVVKNSEKKISYCKSKIIKAKIINFWA